MQKQEAGCITYLCKRFLIKGRDESLSPAKLVNFLLYSQSSVSTVKGADAWLQGTYEQHYRANGMDGHKQRNSFVIIYLLIYVSVRF